MSTNHIELQTREFNALTAEVIEAVSTRDTLTARDALGEIEGVWLHTECPVLREATANFMRQHAAHAKFFRFSA